MISGDGFVRDRKKHFHGIKGLKRVDPKITKNLRGVLFFRRMEGFGTISTNCIIHILFGLHFSTETYYYFSTTQIHCVDRSHFAVLITWID